MEKPPSDRVKIKEKERVKVLSYIRSCIRARMTKTETIDFLVNSYKIQADKTALVWEKMEEENEEFMETYYMILSVTKEIKRLYKLVKLQKRMYKHVAAKSVVLRCIERCIQCDMTKDETIKFLAFHCNIDAALTRTGWKKIKGENKQMFDDYYAKLERKKKITFDCDFAAADGGLIDSSIEQESGYQRWLHEMGLE